MESQIGFLILPRCDVISLWDSLHDGDIISIQSDVAAQAVTFLFEVDYVSKFHGLDPGTKFVLHMGKVFAASVIQSVVPQLPSDYETLPRDTQVLALAQRNGKARWQSESWSEICAQVTTHKTDESYGFEIGNAELLKSDDFISIAIEGSLNDKGWWRIQVCARELTASLSNGKALPVEKWLALGTAYWANFAEKSQKAQRTLAQ